MSIQKIAASAVALNQEANFGLATINFDFAIQKFEAPNEFKGLGRELSQARLKAAEDGAAHITARKLGALFRQFLPSTPHLIKAYGSRASEIASDPRVNPKPSKKHGIFADHVGIDGTSIWAAATSGAESIAVHLLACILARMWSRLEAVAIWAELVSERKEELKQTDIADPRYSMAINDSKIDIARDQLAQWDSSARAWLQAADEAMKIKQTQLMLILDNVSLPVGTKPTLYRNVLQAWTSAMVATNNLLQGSHQSVENGSVLLGISSWHLYPDMLVLQSSPTPVRQADPLFSDGGILTIGLHTERPSETGVSWSLPLGHLRYYGNAVVSSKSLTIQGNRLTAIQLIQLSVGCMTRHWELPELTIVQFLVDLWRLVEPVAHKYSYGTLYWLGHLAEAVKPLLDQESLDAKVGIRLMRLGARRCPNFLAPKNMTSGHPAHQQAGVERCAMPRLFGLSHFNVFTKLLTQSEDCVHYFRELVLDPSLSRFSNRLFIIRYISPRSESGDAYYEYATALPIQRESRKRSHDGRQQTILNPARHLRWIETDLASASGREAYTNKRLEHFMSEGQDSFPYRRDLISASDKTMQWMGTREDFSDYGILYHIITEQNVSDFNDFNHNTHGQRMMYSDFIEADANDQEKESLGFLDFGDDGIMPQKSEMCVIEFEVIMGSMDTAALLVSKTNGKEGIGTLIKPRDRLSSSALLKAIGNEDCYLSKTETLEYLNQLIFTEPLAPILRSMRALATVSRIYNQLPTSTICLSVISQCLPEMTWIPLADKDSLLDKVPLVLMRNDIFKISFRPFELDGSSTFSCLLLLQTGSLSVPPAALLDVMAMATGDSIYIAKSLISDPTEKCLAHEISRIKGSIGKPGIALMIPPKSPLMRQMDLSNWQCVNHNAFDGQLHDSFSSTTLHLGFTDYLFPADVGNHGNRDFEVYFLESLVSVHDRGEWIADLDILRALEKDTTWAVGSTGEWRQPQISSVNECEHVEHAKAKFMGETELQKLTAIDDWNEILDPPGTVAIVRSQDNWLGRLATTAVCRQLGHSVILLPGRVCWVCIRDEWSRISTTPGPGLSPEVGTGCTSTLGYMAFRTKEEGSLFYRMHEPVIEVSIDGVPEIRSESYVKANMMDQGNIFLIC
ncbi:hypothetical protein F5Y19DRAFT_291497 [Xylariaceae sp. FL1651]|nr:hypothetical protein F5Y19DRAFT_291497 [Xylariaceae sp. FL1651]